MSNDMKLIMESWRNNILEEQLKDCEDNDYPIALYIAAHGLFLGDEDKDIKKAKEVYEKLTGTEATRKQLGFINTVGSIIAATIDVGSGGLTAGAATGAVNLAAFTLVEVLEMMANQKIQKGQEKARQILKLFCIDFETLDMVADKYEIAFVNKSGIMEKVKNYFTRSLTDSSLQFPSLMHELVEFINRQTPYKDSPKTDLVER